ncbi:MAG: transposase [Spirochaetaceae bacterium]|jgi:hypothetical protein|nr:transposase [Spirochaetaceae bacterium]
MGLNMKEKQAVTREYTPRYRKAEKKEKSALPDEFTRLAGYHRKSAVRLLGGKPVREVLACADGEAVKLKPEKKRPANRRGKRIYTGEAIAAPRLVRAFFRCECGKILAPLVRQQTEYIAGWPAFHVTEETAEKLKKTSSAAIDRHLKKDRDALRLKGKSLAKPLASLKSRIPIRAFYSGEERKTPGFRQIGTVRRCGQAAYGQYILALTATGAASGWICLYSLLNKARKRTFQSLADIKASVPRPVLEFRSGNGSEFINNAAEIRREKEHLPFTRSRDRKKNSNCFAEQKNGATVREYAGYGRRTRTPSMPSAPFTTRSFFSRMSTGRSCVCATGLPSRTGSSRRRKHSFGNIF